jgi:hypothetical protein
MAATRQQAEGDDADSSTNDSPTDSAGDSNAERLRAYLSEQVTEKGERYFKSKFIADDVGLSSKEIGALMVKLQETTTDLEIEKWSYTNATTWRIAPRANRRAKTSS